MKEPNNIKTEIDIAEAVNHAAHIAAPSFRLFGWSWYKEPRIGVNEISRCLNERIISINKYKSNVSASGRLAVFRFEDDVSSCYQFYLELGHIDGLPKDYLDLSASSIFPHST